MAKVSYIPKDYNSITPYLIVKDGAKAIDYYKRVFGATEMMRMSTPDGRVGHAELKIGNSHIMLADEQPNMGQGHSSAATIGGSPISLYVYLPDVDEVIKRATADGAKVLKPVEDQFYGDRTGFIQDPFGHLWSVATHVEDVASKEMEERHEEAQTRRMIVCSPEARPQASPLRLSSTRFATRIERSHSKPGIA